MHFKAPGGYRPGGPTLGELEVEQDSKQKIFTILPTRLLPIIQSLLGFEWPLPLRGDPKGRDKSRLCEYHKDVGHRSNSCFLLQCLLNYLVSKGHLQEYVESLAPNGPPLSTIQRSVIGTILIASNPAHA